MPGAEEHIPNDGRCFRELSQHDLKDVAFLIGIQNPNRISEWEQGKSKPSMDNLIKLSIVYEVLPDQMYYNLRAKYVKEIAERRELLEERKRSEQDLEAGG